jgi:signal transduction histidine kinase
MALLDRHSMLNLFNVLELQLAALTGRLPHLDFKRYTDFCLDVLLALSDHSIDESIPTMEAHCASLQEELLSIQTEHPEETGLVSGILHVISIGKDRINEFKEDRFAWAKIPKRHFHENLYNFLKATESVSKSRFQFVFPPERPSADTYCVEMSIDEPGDEVKAPVVLQDSIRDLVGNARKYSEPGSRIRIGLSSEGKGLKLSVTDQGIGIPEEEMPLVIQFGYRATNAIDRRTMGGGFGLTKAYNLCKECQGRFFIESELGKGCTIEMSLFPPD